MSANGAVLHPRPVQVGDSVKESYRLLQDLIRLIEYRVEATVIPYPTGDLGLYIDLEDRFMPFQIAAVWLHLVLFAYVYQLLQHRIGYGKLGQELFKAHALQFFLVRRGIIESILLNRI